MKTADLTGAQLDYCVAAAYEVMYDEGRVVQVCRVEATTPAWVERENSPGSAPYYHRFSPSTDWAQGGPIIERERIHLRPNQSDGDHKAFVIIRPIGLAHRHNGPTPLIAAMRCFVASKLGPEVDVPF